MPGMFDITKPIPMPELGDNIINVQAHLVPFQKMVKRTGPPKQMNASWPMQMYPDRGFEGTQDGTDQTTYSHVSRVKASSYGMLLRTQGFQVGKVAQLTADAGVPRKKELAHQILHDGKILAKMSEKQMLSTVDAQEETDSVAYRSRGALQWLNPSAQGVLPVNADFRPPSGAVFTDPLDSFTDSAFEEMLAAMATQKGEPVDLKGLCGLKLKRKMSLWGSKADLASGEAALQTFNLDAKEKRFMSILDKFEFDSGVVWTMVSFSLACTEATGATTDYSPRSGLFIDTSMWEIAEYQAAQAFENPDLGGGPRGYTDRVYILKCLNPMGQGYVLTDTDEAS